MKTKDIKPGVVYGYRRGKTGLVEPVVFLAAPGPDQLYRRKSHPSPGTPLFTHEPQRDKPVRGFRGSGDIGWPAVFGSEDTVAEMTKATLDAFVAATRLHDRGVRYDVVTVSSRIVGPYEEAVAEEKRQRDARIRQYDEDAARREAAQKRAGHLVERLKSYGVKAYGVSARPNRYGEPTALEIPLDDLEKLLGLLGGERP